MFSFLTPYLLWIKLGAAALAFGAAFVGGYWLEGTIKDKTILTMQRNAATVEANARKDAADRQAAADKITHDQDVANATAHQQIVTVTQHIIQKVPQYVTPQTDARFPLNCGWLRLHDAAASGVEPAVIPLPAGKYDADICPVAASVAAGIIAQNYGLALGWRADARTWEKWYADQLAAWNAK